MGLAVASIFAVAAADHHPSRLRVMKAAAAVAVWELAHTAHTAHARSQWCGDGLFANITKLGVAGFASARAPTKERESNM